MVRGARVSSPKTPVQCLRCGQDFPHHQPKPFGCVECQHPPVLNIPQVDGNWSDSFDEDAPLSTFKSRRSAKKARQAERRGQDALSGPSSSPQPPPTRTLRKLQGEGKKVS